MMLEDLPTSAIALAPATRGSVRLGLARGAALALCAAAASCPQRSDERVVRHHLFSRFAEFEAGEGLGSVRLLRLDQDSDRPDEQSRLRLFGPPNGEILSASYELGGNARLDLAVGAEGLDALVPDEGEPREVPSFPPRTFEFGIDWVPADGSARIELGRRRVSHAGRGGERMREPWVVPMSGCRGAGRLALRTRTVTGPSGADVLPTWWSPVIETTAQPRPAAALAVDDVAADLLQVEARGLDATLVEVARHRNAASPDDSSTPWSVVERPRAGVEAHFETGADLGVPFGGNRPALGFAASATVAWSLDVAEWPEGELALGFEPGFHAFGGPARAGSAGLVVRSAGAVVHEETVSATDRAGWGATRRIALPRPLAGRLELEFDVRFGDAGEPDRIERSPGRGGPGSVEQWEVRRSWLGLARPRVVVRRSPAPQRGASPARPNVLFVCVETLRADALGCYGARPSPTPNLDRHAARGLRAHDAYAPAPWTLPSVGSYLTGLPPGIHGAVAEEREVLPDGVRTLAEAARAEGIRTAAFVSNSLVHPDKGFAAGFERFVLAHAATAPQLLALLDGWRSELGDARWFAYVHLFEPHAPLNAPGADRERFVAEELRGRSVFEANARVVASMFRSGGVDEVAEELALLRGRYLGEVASVDRHLGTLLDALDRGGELARTLVVVTSDHGEEFGEHGWYGHGCQLYEESTRVPLLLFGAGVTPGELVAPVPVLAVVPAIARSLGLDSFAASLAGDASPLPLAPQDAGTWTVEVATEKGIDLATRPWPGSGEADPAAGELLARLLDGPIRPRPMLAVRVGAEKVIQRLNGRWSGPPDRLDGAGLEALTERIERFDLSEDPGERAPRVGFGELDATIVRFLLETWRRDRLEGRRLPTMQPAADSAALLRRLGYAAGGAAPQDR